MSSSEFDINESRHRENREAISKVEDRLAEVVTEQTRVATIQAAMNQKTDRLCFIVEGDGNGHPGISKKIDRIDNIATGLLTFLKWVIPLIITWVIAWCSSPTLRHYCLSEMLRVPGEVVAPASAPVNAETPR